MEAHPLRPLHGLAGPVWAVSAPDVSSHELVSVQKLSGHFTKAWAARRVAISSPCALVTYFDESGSAEPRGLAVLNASSRLTVGPVAGKKHVVTVRAFGSHPYHFAFETGDQAQEWAAKLSCCVEVTGHGVPSKPVPEAIRAMACLTKSVSTPSPQNFDHGEPSAVAESPSAMLQNVESSVGLPGASMQLDVLRAQQTYDEIVGLKAALASAQAQVHQYQSALSTLTTAVSNAVHSLSTVDMDAAAPESRPPGPPPSSPTTRTSLMDPATGLPFRDELNPHLGLTHIRNSDEDVSSDEGTSDDGPLAAGAGTFLTEDDYSTASPLALADSHVLASRSAAEALANAAERVARLAEAHSALRAKCARLQQSEGDARSAATKLADTLRQRSQEWTERDHRLTTAALALSRRIASEHEKSRALARQLLAAQTELVAAQVDLGEAQSRPRAPAVTACAQPPSAPAQQQQQQVPTGSPPQLARQRSQSVLHLQTLSFSSHSAGGGGLATPAYPDSARVPASAPHTPLASTPARSVVAAAAASLLQPSPAQNRIKRSASFSHSDDPEATAAAVAGIAAAKAAAAASSSAAARTREAASDENPFAALASPAPRAPQRDWSVSASMVQFDAPPALATLPRPPPAQPPRPYASAQQAQASAAAGRARSGSGSGLFGRGSTT